MAEPFESPKFLIRQTQENLAEFNAICAGLFSGKCSSNVVEIDPQTGNKTYKIKFDKLIPGRARDIATHAVSDLRHSLDQAICDSVRVLTGNDPGLIYFPIATNLDDLNGRLNGRNYETVPPELHPILRSFEPYPSRQGAGGGNDLICDLGKAAGPNKHQVTCAIGARIVAFDAKGIEIIKCIGGFMLPPRWDMTKNEMIIATVTPDGHAKYSLDMTFYIAFDDAGPLTGRAIETELRCLVPVVERIVLGLEAETGRILRVRGQSRPVGARR
jgi:hypothetical protein